MKEKNSTNQTKTPPKHTDIGFSRLTLRINCGKYGVNSLFTDICVMIFSSSLLLKLLLIVNQSRG
jgi:hypothetical protein